MMRLRSYLYRLILGLYSVIVFYIAHEYWLKIILLNPSSFTINIFLFKTFLNTNVLAHISIVLSIALIILGIYKEEVSYIVSSLILIFTVVTLSLIGLYLEGPFVPVFPVLEGLTLSSPISIMSIELIILLISSGLIGYFKPYFKYYRSKGALLTYSLSISILDISITAIGLAIGALALSLIPYTITENIYMSVINLKERIITMLGSITYLILTYPLTIFFIYIGIFLFILYLFKNIVDPVIIFIGKGKGQALSIIKEDFNNFLSKSLSYIRDTDRYMNIGFIILVTTSMIVFLLSASYSVTSSIKYIISSLSQLLVYKHNFATTPIDDYINKVVNQQFIEEYIDKVIRFLRFILSLLF